jgi:pimeloyl-ACP methyl ester carboxylesterase
MLPCERTRAARTGCRPEEDAWRWWSPFRGADRTVPHLQRDGRSLFYREEGEGDPPVVLVHGWCCDHTYLLPQLAHLARRHRVIALDLLGHGRSDKPEQPYPISGFADDVAWAAGQLGLDRPIVIGHSMGGATALELSARHPDVPGAIALLDSTVTMWPERRAQLESLLPALRSSGYRDAMARALEGFFQPWDDADRKARIIQAMTSAPQHVIAGAWAGLLAWDGPAAAAGCRVPALYVAAATLRTDLEQLRRLCPPLLTAQVVAAGHFLQLEVPDQVNAMLDRFIAVARARPTAG